MYNFIKPHYDDDDIWQRKKQYYNQVNSGKRLSPHKVIKLEQVPKPGAVSNIIEGSKLSAQHNAGYLYGNNSNVKLSEQQQLNLSKTNPNPTIQKPSSQSFVNIRLQNSDPQRYKLLQQRAQLYTKLQQVTLGLPITQPTQQTELLAPNYILPHYRSQKITQLKQQQSHIKQLTAQMLQNQKIISKISTTRQQLVDRIGRISKIDQEIYSKLDQDRIHQVERYLLMAKNLLAEGQSEERIGDVLRKVLYC